MKKAAETGLEKGLDLDLLERVADSLYEWERLGGIHRPTVKVMIERIRELESKQSASERRTSVLRTSLTDLATAFHGAWVDHGHEPEDLGGEYDAALIALRDSEQ